MPPRNKALLFDMQHAALGIATYVEGKTLEDYLRDEMLRSAVERQFEIIGEAITRLRKFDPSIAARISEYDRIVAFRNVLIHGYDQIDHATTWRIVQEKLPTLQRELDELLKESPAWWVRREAKEALKRLTPGGK